LKALRASLPDHAFLSEHYVTEFSDILHQLTNAGLDVNEYYVPQRLLAPRIAGFNSVTGETRYTEKSFVEWAFFLSRLGGLLEYLNPETPAPPATSHRIGDITITGSNVTLGDGAHINITNVTVRDILRAADRAAELIENPEQRLSFRKRVGAILSHPMAATVLQMGVPELLRRLSSSDMPGV
jgi:hypothetical protein